MILVVSIFFFLIASCSWWVYFSLKKENSQFATVVNNMGKGRLKLLTIVALYGGVVFTLFSLLNFMRFVGIVE